MIHLQYSYSILYYDSFIVQAIVITIVNYNYNTFIEQANVITIVNYDYNTIIVQDTACKTYLIPPRGESCSQFNKTFSS